MISRSTIRILFTGLVISGLFNLLGCSSAPAKPSYYVLTSAQAPMTEKQPDLNHPLVVIKPIYLSDFLKQTGLVMQTQEHQLHYARSHLWAEKLDEGITKSLLQDLKAADIDYTVSADYRWLAEQALYEIQINIDQFNATDLSSVVMNGSYWIIDTQTKAIVVNRDFNYHQDLQENGYEHSVSKLRELIGQLSSNIGESLKYISDKNKQVGSE
jgi:uncharacterized lipoprotein YmbA